MLAVRPLLSPLPTLPPRSSRPRLAALRLAAPHPTASISPRLLCTDFFPFLRHRLLSVPRAFPRFDAATPSTNTARVPITPNERTFSPSLLSAAIPLDSIYPPPRVNVDSTRRISLAIIPARAPPSRYFESIFRIEPTTFRREVINRNTRIEKGETARGDELQRPNRDKGRYHLEQRGERERLPRSDPTYSRAAR